VCPRSSPPPGEPSEFHRVDPTTIPHINDDPDWVDAPIPVPTPVFQTPLVADHNPINNQLAEALQQLSENLNRGSAPKPHQSKAHIPDTFDGSDPHKLNHFLFQYRLFFRANPLQFSTDEEKINFAMTYLSGVVQDWFKVALQQEDLSYAQPWLQGQADVKGAGVQESVAIVTFSAKVQKTGELGMCLSHHWNRGWRRQRKWHRQGRYVWYGQRRGLATSCVSCCN